MDDIVTRQEVRLVADSPRQEILVTSSPKSGAGTKDYNLLFNKPRINDVELIGNMSLSSLGILSEDDIDITIVSEQDIDDLIDNFVQGG